MRKRIGGWLLFLVLLVGCGCGRYEPVEMAKEEAQAAGAEEGQDLGGTGSQDGELTGDAGAEIVIQAVDDGQTGAEIVIETEDTGDEQELGTQGLRTQEPESIRLLFAGDVLLSDHVLQAWEKAGGISGVLDEGYRSLIGDADYFLVNEEFPFSSRGTKAADKQYTFRLPPEKVEIFHQMGIDGVTLANNHALDYGQDALLDTCQVLDEAGILHTGAGKDLDTACQAMVLEAAGKSIAVIGATRVIPVSDWAAGKNHPGMLATYDPSLLLEQIRALKKKHDYVIVYVHWGIERAEKPEDYQRSLGKQYIDAGADLVIGAHPHVLQGIEYYQGKPIVYSLGNFVFGSSIPRTMVLEVELLPSMQIRIYPGTSSAGYTRMHPEGQAREEAYRYLEQISFGIQVDENGLVEPSQAQP